ncbi:MAG: hypothetical protein QXV22_03330, partial [Thermoplasmataceae archaeon]
RVFLAELKDLFFVVMDRGCALTKLQIAEAYRRSLAITGRSGRYKKPESVFIILLSGKLQISEALEACGISTSSRIAVVVTDRHDFLEIFERKFQNSITKSDEAIPNDDPELDGLIFPRMTYISLEL